jgi:hypothetical protein
LPLAEQRQTLRKGAGAHFTLPERDCVAAGFRPRRASWCFIVRIMLAANTFYRWLVRN